MTTPAAPTAAAIIETEMSNGANIREMTEDEWFDFMDYCIAATCGSAEFYLPDDVAPFQITPEEQTP